MKKWYVYELVNLMGTVEYVGETQNPKNRFNNHKCRSGKFYKRSDIFMNLVKEFNSKIDAYNFQCQLQNQYGFENDTEKFTKVRLIGSKIRGNQNITNGVLEKARNSMKLKSSKPIIAINLNSNELIEFTSIHHAARELQLSPGNICRILKGIRKTLKSFTFEYKNKNSID